MALPAPIPDLMAGASTPGRPPGGSAPNLDTLSITELLSLRTQVEQRLPARDLQDLDLARELVLQVLALQQMQQKALEDGDTPVNQLAQAANSLSAALTNLVKLQADVYSSERFKKIEQVLIDTLQVLPTETQETFITAYTAALEVVR